MKNEFNMQEPSSILLMYMKLNTEKRNMKLCIEKRNIEPYIVKRKSYPINKFVIRHQRSFVNEFSCPSLRQLTPLWGQEATMTMHCLPDGTANPRYPREDVGFRAR